MLSMVGCCLDMSKQFCVDLLFFLFKATVDVGKDCLELLINELLNLDLQVFGLSIILLFPPHRAVIPLVT